jgi:hypothetical protein
MSNIQSSPLPLPPRSSVSSLVTNISASSNTNRAITNSHRESVIAEANAVFKRGTTTGRSPINSKLTTSRRTNRKTHVTFKDFVRLEPRRYRKNRERKMRLIYTFKKAEKTQMMKRATRHFHTTPPNAVISAIFFLFPAA